MNTSDLIIIGAAQGGQALALHAAKQGQRVVLFEDDPQARPDFAAHAMQSLLSATSTLRAANHLQSAAITGTWEPDIARLLAYVKQQADVYTPLVEHDNLTVITRRAAFSAQSIITDGKTQYRAPRIVISTGSLPMLPDTPSQLQGLSDSPYLTPETLFDLKELPARIAILGAGRTGVQLAQALATLGTQVHLIDRHDRVLPGLPESVSQVISQALAGDGVTMHLGSVVTAVSYRDGRHTIRCANDDEIITDAFILATGRRPATHALDCTLGKIALTEQGHIEVDAHLQTNIEGIYAIGSCVDQQLGQTYSWEDHLRLIDQWGLGEGKAHKATRRRLDRPRVYGVATNPQVSHIGLWRDEAELVGYRVAAAHQSLSDTSLPIASPGFEGFLELLIDEPSGKLLGATLVGPGAMEVATMLTPLFVQGSTWHDLTASPMIAGTWGQHLKTLVRQFASED